MYILAKQQAVADIIDRVSATWIDSIMGHAVSIKPFAVLACNDVGRVAAGLPPSDTAGPISSPYGVA